MAFRSPYRGEDPIVPWSPRVREFVSRGTMALVGVVMIYFCVHGTTSLYAMQKAAATQPILPSISTSISTYPPRRSEPTLPWVMLFALGLLGGATLAAALLPVAAMQKLFERWNQPPITGDRSATTNSGRFFDGWWP